MKDLIPNMSLLAFLFSLATLSSEIALAQVPKPLPPLNNPLIGNCTIVTNVETQSVKNFCLVQVGNDLDSLITMAFVWNGKQTDGSAEVYTAGVYLQNLIDSHQHNISDIGIYGDDGHIATSFVTDKPTGSFAISEDLTAPEGLQLPIIVTLDTIQYKGFYSSRSTRLPNNGSAGF